MHAIMFHYFNNEKHIRCQGSLSAEKLDELLDFYEKEYNIISAQEFLYKLDRENIGERDVCLTFDDGLLCQYDIARPVLERRHLNAFYFIYTSHLSNGNIPRLEIYHHFRFSAFDSIDDFYEAFFNNVLMLGEEYMYEARKSCPQKTETYYTDNDLMFRHLRDCILGEELYFDIMDRMITDSGYDIPNSICKLLVNKDQIRELYSAGNIIGTHSHSHPTVMSNLSYEEQKREYTESIETLTGITNDTVTAAAYPCGSYNSDTIKIMDELNIVTAFIDNMAQQNPIYNPRLVLPRIDSSDICIRMENQ